MVHGAIFSLVHAVVLLAVSYFILLTARKSDSQNLKVFGYCIAVLLWVGAALILGKGISGNNREFHKMQFMGEKMERKMNCSGPGAMQQANPQLPQGR